jgi:predicted dehydrogenase
MSKTIRMAVIGAGKLGLRHAERYAKMSGVELVGVCDVRQDRAEHAAKLCGSKAFTDFNALTGIVDAASIVVPSPDHHAVSKPFLQKGVHLLIEKPLTTNLADADDLLRLAAEHKCLVQVGHIERFNSAIRAMKNVIKNPRFIEAHRLGPYDPRVADTGVTLDLMIHDLDIVLDLVGTQIRSVDAAGAAILSATEDIANARIRFEGGCVANLTASRVTPEVVRRIRIFQDDASLSLDYVNQEAQIYTRENGRIHHNRIDIAKADALQEELTDFVRCVRSGERPLVSGEVARRALEVALNVSEQIAAPTASRT